MARIILITCALVLFSGCDNSRELDYAAEASALSVVVKEVAIELNQLGFEVDPSTIHIEVRDGATLAEMFNQIIVESKEYMGDNTPFAPPTVDSDLLDQSDPADRRSAFYDPNTKTLVFTAGSLNTISPGYIAHELAHVYQDQRWGLNHIWQKYKNNPTKEQFNIIQYLVEGHAELARHAYEQAHAPNRLAFSDLGAWLGKMVENECIVCNGKEPASNLPYSMGMRFLAHQYKVGGWPAVEKNLLKPPISSEQILHPDKFPVDKPSTITLPLWPRENPDAELEYDGAMGEASLLTKLLDIKVPSIEAFTCASGWDGDVAHIYKTPGGKETLVWRIVFDREIDAKQLESALNSYDTTGSNFREGAVVDWVTSEQPNTVSKLRAFLAEHPLSFEQDEKDDISTDSQESEGISSAINFYEPPQRRTKMFIGPKE